MDSFVLFRGFMMLMLGVLAFCSSVPVFANAKTIHRRDDAEAALADARALIEFKRGITIDPLNTLANWNWNEDAPTTRTACNWTGITCSSKHPGRVVQIHLEDALLVGSISPSIANLSFLQVLVLYNSSFSGDIPSSVGKLRRLKALDLCQNYLDGPIPPTIGNLSSLVELDLCFNSFTGTIPQSFTYLISLEVLDLYTNLLSGKIPPWLGSLSKLNLVDLSTNKFHGFLPPQLGNLSSLQHLALAQNALVGSIPCIIAKLPNLYVLLVGDNHLSGNIPPCLTNLTSLRELDLSINHIHGTIPSSLTSLHDLVGLYLEANSLEGTIPECLLNISSLQSLGLSSNKLSGPLPSWIGRLNKLQRLSLNGNNFFGRIPDSLTNATQLQALYVSDNFLTGTIPCSFGKLKILSILWLQKNYLTSGFPFSKPGQSCSGFTVLSNLSGLVYFNMGENLIYGALPSDIGSFWPRLERLFLFHNFISGKIPDSIGNFSFLFQIDLTDNMLQGTLPFKIANIKSIQYLSLSKNRLHGKMPPQISLVNRFLAYLDLSGNRFWGSIPQSIGELVNLRQLSLRRNLLSGRIPAELGKCYLLESLVLSENQLSGTMPAEVAALKHIIFEFDLSRNRLSGPVPAEIGGMEMAQYINLSNNQLSGDIGLCMQNWLDARQVNLSLNNFSGSISASIGNKLRQLQGIDLSHNSFNGSVPKSLFNLSHLHYLNISYNDFSGEIPCSQIAGQTSRFSKLSVMGNPKICGNCLGLPMCDRFNAHHSSDFRTNKILKVICISSSSAVVFLLFCAGIFSYLHKTRLIGGQTLSFHSAFLKMSVEELERATNNFSSANLLGEGRHGKVYKGKLTSGQNVAVAIKCFFCSNEMIPQKIFKRECEILKKVRHRNIVKIITVLWSDDVKAIIMPFMSNGSLHSLLHCRQNGSGTLVPLNLATRLRILRELACGLSYLHHDCTPQVIHCDIKPENVLLDEDTTVKLSDFGIAWIFGNMDASVTITSSGIRGTVGYIAPEYGTGEAVSEKGDVYSFGAVTLEVMTRLKPTHDMFSGDLTLPKFVSRAFQGDTPQQRRQSLQEILVRTDSEGGDGGGINMENEEEMKAVDNILMVGLRCTCEDAYMRPTMREVESMLSSINIEDNAYRRTFPESLEQVLELVRVQKPLLCNAASTESSTSS